MVQLRAPLLLNGRTRQGGEVLMLPFDLAETLIVRRRANSISHSALLRPRR
jgi:hypothetical protein